MFFDTVILKDFVKKNKKDNWIFKIELQKDNLFVFSFEFNLVLKDFPNVQSIINSFIFNDNQNIDDTITCSLNNFETQIVNSSNDIYNFLNSELFISMFNNIRFLSILIKNKKISLSDC